MSGLTPTREAREFLLATVVLLCASAPSLTSEIHARLGWQRRAGRGYTLVHLAVMLVLGGSGWLLVGIRLLPAARGPLPSGLMMAACAAAGVPTGLLTARADRAVTRAGRLQRPHGRAAPTAAAQAQPDARAATSFTLPQLLLVAAAEEIVYRGVLPSACLALPRLAAAAGLILAAALFPLSHARFGWRQVAAKTPLSVSALACVLVSGSLLAAIVAHGTFNADMWRERRRRGGSGPVSPGSRPAAAPVPGRLR